MLGVERSCSLVIRIDHGIGNRASAQGSGTLEQPLLPDVIRASGRAGLDRLRMGLAAIGKESSFTWTADDRMIANPSRSAPA